MLTPVVAWMNAAVDALTAGLPAGTVVLDGPTTAEHSGADLVIVGWDGDDERGTGAEYEGGWHGIGANAPQAGEAVVYVTAVSKSGPPVSMRDRRSAALVLHALVTGVLFPSAPGSALGVAGVHWAEQSSWRLLQLPTESGNYAHVVTAVRLKLAPA